MKVIPIFFFFLISFFAGAQDSLFKKNKEVIACKVLEINSQDVTFKKQGLLDGPTYREEVKNILQIRFANGSIESFGRTVQSSINSNPVATYNDTPSSQETRSSTFSTNDYMRGMNDASRYYRGYKGAGTATLITTLVFSPIGLVTAIGCSVSSPNEHNLMVPDYKLMDNPTYADGYRKKAWRKKAGRVWGNFAIGIGVNIAATLILIGVTQ